MHFYGDFFTWLARFKVDARFVVFRAMNRRTPIVAEANAINVLSIG